MYKYKHIHIHIHIIICMYRFIWKHFIITLDDNISVFRNPPMSSPVLPNGEPFSLATCNRTNIHLHSANLLSQPAHKWHAASIAFPGHFRSTFGTSQIKSENIQNRVRRNFQASLKVTCHRLNCAPTGECRFLTSSMSYWRLLKPVLASERPLESPRRALTECSWQHSMVMIQEGGSKSW